MRCLEPDHDTARMDAENMKQTKDGSSGAGALGALLAITCLLAPLDASQAAQGTPGTEGPHGTGGPAPTLAETRVSMGKWIETQQILVKERNEWQQGKEILLGRLELLRNEVGNLEQKIAEAQTSLTEAEAKLAEQNAEKDRLVETGRKLAETVARLEAEVRRLYRLAPDPTQEKLQPLLQRIPQDPATARVSVAERFQNVLGVLSELNRANGEITVTYEVRTLADGRPAEVRALYVGLAQAYYVSAGGEAGIGRPTDEGWSWEPSRAIAGDVLEALEILQGKHTPAFVPLPVRIQ